MARIRQLIGKPAVTTVLFILAIALLLGGTLGVAWAALNAESAMAVGKHPTSRQQAIAKMKIFFISIPPRKQ